jgi:DNA polymerase, archaea type
MFTPLFSLNQNALSDELIYGHGPLPGIVSVHAEQSGQVTLWQRISEHRVVTHHTHFRPWVYAQHLEDLAHLGAGLTHLTDTRLTGLDHPDLAAPSLEAPFSAHLLSGPARSLRYLISANDGRALLRHLLGGASKRLGRRISSLRDQSDYHCVSPIQGYLMASGRTYYKGLNFNDLHRLQFDLETTSLTPETGRIFMVAVCDNRGFEAVLEAPTPESERALITELVALIRRLNPDVIENHNIMRFDLPFLMGRAQVLGVPLYIGRSGIGGFGGPAGIWRVQDGAANPHWATFGREIVDTIDAVRRLNLPSTGLKQVSKLYGLAPEGRVYLDGASIFETYGREPETVRRYALQDVQEVRLLAERVLAPSFALAQMAPRPYHRLPYAGTATGMLEPMLVRAYLHARSALPGPAGKPGAPHRGGAVRLYAEGVMQRVVKADIASMYPSLIRAWRIGPACDPHGVFLHLMDHLTALRLHHKQAARAEMHTGGNQHEAIQSAMKLVVNSGYGYLGAGPLALFGDHAAADEVTRRGRALLGQVTDALNVAGVTLIEADTDGVYFSVPTGWSEAQERGLVADIDSTLPGGVTLEFEGRYQAMLSHEIKNYALLGYDGQLTLRGAAFQSSRSESYGQDFLRAALPCLMTGDLPGVQHAFQKVREEVCRSRLSNAEVASRVRVCRSPEAYAATRSGRKEAVYEAMLAAGRKWRPRESVSFYMRRGAYIEHGAQLALLESCSDPDDPAGCDYDAGWYEANLIKTYASRLKKGLHPAAYGQLFTQPRQAGLFDLPLETLQTRWASLE